jgi:hypothetical protein
MRSLCLALYNKIARWQISFFACKEIVIVESLNDGYLAKTAG